MSADETNLMEQAPPTTHFGFTRIGPEEGLSKAGWAALDRDRVLLDALLYALSTHTHAEGERLADPADPPYAELQATGGTLPANTVFHYSIAWVDDTGLETAASPEAAVRTLAAIDPPPPVTFAVSATGGTLRTGAYTYLVTFTDAAGGETTPSRAATATVEGSTGSVALTLPTRPTGATGWRVYRAGGGSTRYGLLASPTASPWTDTGAAAPDTTYTVPRANTTGSSASTVVTLPGQPEGAVLCRVYRTTVPDDYVGAALIAEIAADAPVLLDTGLAAGRGTRRSVSATTGNPPPIDYTQLTGAPPPPEIPEPEPIRGNRNWSVAAAGPVAHARDIARTRLTEDVLPTALTVFFASPPAQWNREIVTVQIADTAGHAIEVATEHVEPYYVRTWPQPVSGDVDLAAGALTGAATLTDGEVHLPSGSTVTFNLAVPPFADPLPAGDYTYDIALAAGTVETELRTDGGNPVYGAMGAGWSPTTRAFAADGTSTYTLLLRNAESPTLPRLTGLAVAGELEAPLSAGDLTVTTYVTLADANRLAGAAYLTVTLTGGADVPPGEDTGGQPGGGGGGGETPESAWGDLQVVLQY